MTDPGGRAFDEANPMGLDEDGLRLEHMEFYELLAHARSLETALRGYEEVVSAAKAWDFAHRNPYQLNMPKREQRLRGAVAALSHTPVIDPAQRAEDWPVADLSHTPDTEGKK